MMMIAIAVPAGVVLMVVIIIIICVIKKKKAQANMYDIGSSDKGDKDEVSNDSFANANLKERASIEQIEEDPYLFSKDEPSGPTSPAKTPAKPMKRKKTRKAQNNSLFVYNNMPKGSNDKLEEDYDFEQEYGSPGRH